MRTPRKLLGAAWGAGLLLFLVGKDSSRTAFTGSSWHGEQVRKANVACRASGTCKTSRPDDKKLTREDKMELEGEILRLTDLAELKKAQAAAKKTIFKYDLDGLVRQRKPDSRICLKSLYKMELAQKKIWSIMAEEEAIEAMKVKIPTYTEWMETNLDLDWMKNRMNFPSFRPMYNDWLYSNDLPIQSEYFFKQQFEKRYGYRYDEPNSWEEFTAKGGEEWWKGQRQLKREEHQAKYKAQKEEKKEQNAAWMKLWAAEAEVRKQELGRT